MVGCRRRTVRLPTQLLRPIWQQRLGTHTLAPQTCVRECSEIPRTLPKPCPCRKYLGITRIEHPEGPFGWLAVGVTQFCCPHIFTQFYPIWQHQLGNHISAAETCVRGCSVRPLTLPKPWLCQNYVGSTPIQADLGQLSCPLWVDIHTVPWLACCLAPQLLSPPGNFIGTGWYAFFT